MTTFIITGVLGIVLILVLSLVVYRVFYNYRANKALNTGIPVKTLSPGAILISLVFVLIMVMNILLFNEVVSTANKINTLQLQNNNLIVMIDNMSHDLSEQILDNTKNTYDDKFVYNGLDENDKLTFDLSFKIKSLDKNGIVSVLVEDSEGEYDEYNVTIDEYTFSTVLFLSIEDEYKVYLKIESSDNILIEEIETLNPLDFLQSRFEYYPIISVFHENEFKITLNNSISMINDSLEGLEIDYIELYVYDSNTGESETIRVEEFSTYNSEYGYNEATVNIQALFIGEFSHSKDTDFIAYVTVFDKDGHYYSFEVELRYTSEIRITEYE